MLDKSYHQMMVEAFMLRANQEVPVTASMPSTEVRLLRAKLIMEEALETVAALGVAVYHDAEASQAISDGYYLTFAPNNGFDFIEVVDGCCDLRVVTTGTLSALGVPDVPVQCEVDENNLKKFGPGHRLREDGKLLKPPGHKGPRIQAILDTLFPGFLG